jgi:GT2 family glycosyltransferase
VITKDSKVRATVILATRNRRQDLVRALSSCERQTELVNVVVVDDASDDGTCEVVTRDFPHVQVHRNTRPMGYIHARNFAARQATTPFLFSIDDDAEYGDPTTVERAISFFDHPRAAALSLPFRNTTTDSPATTAPPDAHQFWTSYAFVGTAYAMRRDVFRQLGGYDVDFFHQGEEIDLCLRLLASGYVVRLVDTPPISHFESPNRDIARQDIYGRRNDVLIGWRNAPFPWLLDYWLRMFARGITLGMKTKRMGNMLRGFGAGISYCVRHTGSRRPMDHRTWRFSRVLRSKGPMLLSDVEPHLAPLAGVKDAG